MLRPATRTGHPHGRPELWLQHACAVAGGGLTPEQWEEVVPEQDYVSACQPG